MRITTVAAGVLLSIIGAFCFIFSGYSFSSTAFVVGMAMLAAGALETASWVISGKSVRQPDTLLVEGIVTALFGFAVLNDQVPDALVSMFFGSLTTISGATRVSQSLAVSLYKPRDWAKVMAFAVMVSLFGVIMMMPALLSAASPMILVGASFILNGFSLLVYSMFMDSRDSSRGAEEARARRAAKAAAAEQKRREREYLRSLSRKERAEAVAEKKRLRREAEEQRREERRLKREEKEAASRIAAEDTITLSDEDVRQIKKAADELGFTDLEQESGIAAAAAVIAAGASENDLTGSTEAEDGGIQSPAGSADAESPEAAAPGSVSAAAPAADPGPSFWPEFKKPEDIPRLRTQAAEEEAPAEEEVPAEEPVQLRNAVNLEAIEASEIDLSFGDIELPPADTRAEGGEAWKRLDILREIDSKKEKKEEYRAFTGLKEGELSSEKQRKRLSDEGIFDHKLSFDPLNGVKAEPGAAEGEGPEDR